ncbi:Gpr1 family protein [Coprinopsis cinerea okayama7|uniref:Gpr1 family protein n=1 Tax=Coprinopsis cinerea (strain Okayama-7 / 130 / ATCC MYA-4618 / FGSC 9003) TaxID=240176 RepID=A8PFL4_COPC7|nr:Gpr1 family protein [Coprinopsis cinerea okayama7\|eukprot:XP_001841089.1 Gpr1 family protein [Coprinopsis cinerea okayama7\
MSSGKQCIEKAEYSSSGAVSTQAPAYQAPPTPAPAPPAPPPIGNPTPAGMFAFAGTMLLMALYNLGAGGITTPNVLVGMLIFAGGIAQLLVSILEFLKGNCLYATCFMTFSTFWLSYGAVLIPGFGILQAFTDPSEIGRAIGLYLFVWWITITMLLIAVVGKSTLFTILLSFASCAVLISACGQYLANKALNIVGNSLLIVVCSEAYYIGLAVLLLSEPGAIFTLPMF